MPRIIAKFTIPANVKENWRDKERGSYDDYRNSMYGGPAFTGNTKNGRHVYDVLNTKPKTLIYVHTKDDLELLIKSARQHAGAWSEVEDVPLMEYVSEF